MMWNPQLQFNMGLFSRMQTCGCLKLCSADDCCMALLVILTNQRQMRALSTSWWKSTTLHMLLENFIHTDGRSNTNVCVCVWLGSICIITDCNKIHYFKSLRKCLNKPYIFLSFNSNIYFLNSSFFKC